jgi:hypothetical protein
MTDNPKPKFQCGLKRLGILKCQYNKKKECTFDAGKGVKCAYRKNMENK